MGSTHLVVSLRCHAERYRCAGRQFSSQRFSPARCIKKLHQIRQAQAESFIVFDPLKSDSRFVSGDPAALTTFAILAIRLHLDLDFAFPSRSDRQKDLFVGEDWKAKPSNATPHAPKQRAEPAIVTFLLFKFFASLFAGEPCRLWVTWVEPYLFMES